LKISYKNKTYEIIRESSGLIETIECGWETAGTSRCPAGWEIGWDTAGTSRCPAGWLGHGWHQPVSSRLADWLAPAG